MSDQAESTARRAPDRPSLRYAIPEPSRWSLELLEIVPVTPSVHRLRFTTTPIGADGRAGPDGARLDYAPGQDLALSLPAPMQGSTNRRYTISGHDRSTGVLEIEAVVHGDGPGARWVREVHPGDRVEAFGPRGKITVVDGVGTHLLVVDEASLPAGVAIVAALAPGERAIVLADVAGEDEQRPVTAAPGVGIDLAWLERAGGAPESPDRVLAALAILELDLDDTHAYVFGEFKVVNAVRRLLGERLGSARVSPKPYWREGRANAGHGEPVRDE